MQQNNYTDSIAFHQVVESVLYRILTAGKQFFYPHPQHTDKRSAVGHTKTAEITWLPAHH